VRNLAAIAIALTLVFGTVAPSVASDGGNNGFDDPRTARAMAALESPCLVAQVAPEGNASASPSPSPTATPTLIPLPVVPGGPGVLIPPPLPSTTPQVSPPPIPSPSPSPSFSPGPQYLVPATPTPLATPTITPTAGPIYTPSPTPTSSATAAATPAPVFTPAQIKRGSPPPSPAATAKPAAEATLAPGKYAILGDKLTGNRNPGQPFDLDGHVNVIYQDGMLVGDHAHYDGVRYIDITGHTYLRNRIGDSTYTADSIRFDTFDQTATMINGHGDSTEGVESGKLYFGARELVTERNGDTHGTRASLTTCENPHGGYHIEAKTLDITPGQRAVMRHVVLFLGPLAILYLPVLIIPLRREEGVGGRRADFIPLIGYSAAEGFYVKAKIGFGKTPYYYGYYRIEYYTKIGYGLGYVASWRTKHNKRAIDVDIFRLYNKTDGSQTWNINFSDQENISPALRATARYSYQADYGPLITLPAATTLALGLTKTTKKDTENFSYQQQTTQGESTTSNYGIADNYQFSTKFSNAFTASYTTNTSYLYTGGSDVNSTLHFNDDLHLTGNTWDYDLILDRYDGTVPSSASTLPELLLRPHGTLTPWFHAFPITGTFSYGLFSDPISKLATTRGEAQINLGPGLWSTPIGLFNGTVNVRQDDYGTGDEHAQIEQQFTLTTPLGPHFDNILSYSNQHVNGLGDEPFTFDTIGGAYKNLQEVFKVFNGDTYALTLQTGTAFNMAAQPIQYQLLTRPSPLSTVVIGGAWTPGPGNGFNTTNVQIISPFGRGSDIQFSTFVDWKNKGRLESKTVYYRRIIGDCYEVRVSYNEDLKSVAVTLDILAFPSQALNFGLGQTTSIIPQSFATDQFFGTQ
jgi:hypothetical protein